MISFALTLACELGFACIKLKFGFGDNLKLDLYETHDRWHDFTKKDSKQSLSIGKSVQKIVDQKPFGNHPFYVFSHTRTDDDGVTKRLIHQPRLTKPKAQTNSMLFRAYPGTDKIKIIWMIPAPEMWDQYKKGNVTENDRVAWSIQMYKTNRSALERKEPDDLSDEEIDRIYTEISRQAKISKQVKQVKIINETEMTDKRVEALILPD